MSLLGTLPAGIPLVILVVGALASGVARGFSGFGAALIFIPLASVALGPRMAAPLLLLIDFLPMIALVPGAWRLADRREVAWLSLGVVAGLPFGVWLLAQADALTLRWLVAGVILALLAMAASGLRFPATPNRGATLGVGAKLLFAPQNASRAVAMHAMLEALVEVPTAVPTQHVVNLELDVVGLAVYVVNGLLVVD